jgi:hypothetical protein
MISCNASSDSEMPPRLMMPEATAVGCGVTLAGTAVPDGGRGVSIVPGMMLTDPGLGVNNVSTEAGRPAYFPEPSEYTAIFPAIKATLTHHDKYGT